MSTRLIRLVPYDETYLERSWSWLNDPEIKAMTMTPDFTRDDQRTFFASLPDRQDYRIWGVEALDGTPIGAAGLKHVSAQQAEVWLYIGERAWWGSGAGSDILSNLADVANDCQIPRLVAHVRKGNERSVRAFERAGYAVIEKGEVMVMERQPVEGRPDAR